MNTVNRQQTDLTARETLIMLLAPAVMSWYIYGERAVRLILASVVFSLAVSIVCDKLLGKKLQVLNARAAVTGALVALMLPASTSWTLLGTAILFSFIAASLPFGNGEKTPFVPAAAGIAFVTVCREVSVFTYPSLLYDVVAKTDGAFVAGTSLSSMLRSGSSIFGGSSSILQTFIGDYSGPMGASCAVVLIVLSVYLLIRHPKRFLIFAGYLAAVIAFAALFPRVLTGSLISVVMEVCSGLVLFGGVFLLCAPCGSPKKAMASLLFGLTGGVTVMLFNRYGVFEDSVCFAVLIMNALSPLFERVGKKEAVRE